VFVKPVVPGEGSPNYSNNWHPLARTPTMGWQPSNCLSWNFQKHV